MWPQNLEQSSLSQQGLLANKVLLLSVFRTKTCSVSPDSLKWRLNKTVPVYTRKQTETELNTETETVCLFLRNEQTWKVLSELQREKMVVDIRTWEQTFQELIQEAKPWAKWTLKLDENLQLDCLAQGWKQYQQRAFGWWVWVSQAIALLRTEAQAQLSMIYSSESLLKQ